MVARIARARRMAQGMGAMESVRRTTSAFSMAAAVPMVPMARETSAAARAGASLTPSPTTATPRGVGRA
jgi:hypothetical protein